MHRVIANVTFVANDGEVAIDVSAIGTSILRMVWLYGKPQKMLARGREGDRLSNEGSYFP